MRKLLLSSAAALLAFAPAVGALADESSSSSTSSTSSISSVSSSSSETSSVSSSTPVSSSSVSSTSSSSVSSSSSSKSKKGGKGEIDVACIQAAVTKRDTAIITAAGVFSTAWVDALEARRDALVAAWGMTDKNQRKQALKNAWKTYRESFKSTRKTFNQSRKSAWKTFKQEAKGCRGSSDDEGGEGIDQL